MMSLSAATPIVTPTVTSTVTPTVAQTARRANNCDDSKSTCPRLAIASRLPALTRLAVANSQRMAGQLRDWSLVKLAIDQQSQRPSLLGLIADPPIPTIRPSNPPAGEEASDCCDQQSNQSIGPTSDGHGLERLGMLLGLLLALLPHQSTGPIQAVPVFAFAFSQPSRRRHASGIHQASQALRIRSESGRHA